MCHLYVSFDSVLTVSEFAKECNSWSVAETANLRLSSGDRQNLPSSVVAFCVSCRRWSVRKYAGSSPNSRRQHKGDVCRKEKPTWWRNPGERTRAQSNLALRAPPSGDEWDCKETIYDSMAPVWPPLTGKLSYSFLWTHTRVGKDLARVCVQHFLNLNMDNLILQNHMKANSNVLPVVIKQISNITQQRI